MSFISDASHTPSLDQRSSGTVAGPRMRKRVRQRQANADGTRTHLSTHAHLHHPAQPHRRPRILLVHDHDPDAALVPQHVCPQPGRHQGSHEREQWRRKAAENGIQTGAVGQLAPGRRVTTGSGHDDVIVVWLQSAHHIDHGSGTSPVSADAVDVSGVERGNTVPAAVPAHTNFPAKRGNSATTTATTNNFAKWY